MKTIIFSALMAISTVSFAQSFWVKFCPTFTNMLLKDNDNRIDSKMIFGYDLGAFAEFPVNENFSFETGIQFTSKGMKANDADTDLKLELSYIDIPLTAKIAFKLAGIKAYGAFGPYVGYGIGGQIYIDGLGTKVKWGSNGESDNLKPLDYGLNIGAGIEINALQIGLSYGYGLANINPTSDNGAKASNRALGISVGYRFAKI
jgi:hypothetical protein